jgi:hypothetical protein
MCQLIDALHIQSLTKLFKRENSPNTYDSVDESLAKLFERSGQEKMEKFFRLEKFVQDKINCTNCIYVLFIYCIY